MQIIDIEFEQFIYLNFLLSIKSIGPKRLINIIKKYPSIVELRKANNKHLENIDLLSNNIANYIITSLSNYFKYEKLFSSHYDYCLKNNISIIPYWSEKYPKQLSEIDDPPILIYLKGDITSYNENSIAIVGTRNPTHYGKTQTEILTKDLVNNNITIVSGLALGIDTIAHNTALKYNGKTIAIIGSGLDIIYPSQNKTLSEKIIENGILISEYSLGTQPNPENFPRRNRIISALSKAVLVIETRMNGGAMITAKIAISQNKKLYAIPGNISSEMSDGTNFLIKTNKAKLITSANDIIEDLGLFAKMDKKDLSKLSLGIFELEIMNLLNDEPKHIDDVARNLNLSTQDTLVSLLNLEFEGLIKQLPGKYFIKL
mgnify:CR=1 FL=1